MSSASLSLGSLRTRRLIGRIKERETIKAAIEAEDRLRIIHVIGNGGMGKTRLLEAIDEEILPQCANRDRCKQGGIFDLYHVDIHTNSGIEAAIIKVLDPQGFRRYRAGRRAYEKLRQAHGVPGRLEELREELGTLFVEGYNEFTKQKRVILCFDTVELVQHESDSVQEICEIKHRRGVEVRDWLVSVVPQLENTLVILAGRPNPRLWEELQAEFAQAIADREERASQNRLDLERFSPKEVCEYFADLAEQNPLIAQEALTEGNCAEIHQITEGKPLRIAFISTLIVTKNLPLQRLLREMGPETIDQRLIGEIQRLTEDVDVALPCVAWMRKGIDAHLLQKLLEGVRGKKWGISKCRRVLKDLETFPFVKSRPDSRLVFLHDEMYGLMDKYVLSRSGYSEDQEKVCRIADEYYAAKIDKAKGRKRQDWQLEQLYYRLLTSPREGFNQYRLLSDEAIIMHEVGFDMSLRDEMLRFLEQRGSGAARAQVARDSAVRWVNRLLEMQHTQEAMEVARRIWEHDSPPFQRTEDDPHFTAALQIYWNEASLYLAESTKAFEKVIGLMREAIEPLEAAEPTDEYQGRSRTHLLGRAYNDLGYAHTRLRDYRLAVAEYSRAIYWLKRSGFWGRVADTEKNLAFVYAMLGEWSDAENLCEQSLRRNRELGRRWGEAMALNVYGLVEVENDNPHRARKRCRDALAIFADLNDQRGIGLASIALGRALRKLGSQDTYLFSRDADEFLREATSRLVHALAIFSGVVSEPVREVEALAELGRIYRDEAYVYRQRGEAAEPQVGELERQAEDHLRRAAEKARELEMLVEETDAYADLAALCFNGRAYDKALEWVAEAETRLPSECLLIPERRTLLPECPSPQYFLILGKCSLLRGDVAWALGQQKEKDAEEGMEEAVRKQFQREALGFAILQALGRSERPDLVEGCSQRLLRQAQDACSRFSPKTIEPWEKAAEAYQQAVAWWTKAFGYCERYSSTATTLSLSARRIRRRLMTLWPAQLRFLQQHCHRVEETHGLPATTLHGEFPGVIRAAALLRGEDADEDVG